MVALHYVTDYSMLYVQLSIYVKHVVSNSFPDMHRNTLRFTPNYRIIKSTQEHCHWHINAPNTTANGQNIILSINRHVLNTICLLIYSAR